MKENKMGVMPENKLLLTMSLPIILSMLIQALYNVVDSIFVSRISEDALTAVSLAFPFQTLMLSVAVGTGVGINAILSRSLGQKDFSKVNTIAEHGFILFAISYIVFAILGFLLSDYFFGIQTNNSMIYQYGSDYLKVITIFSFGMFFQILSERLLQSTGRTINTMVTQAVGATINIILDPILIFGLFGFPRLEVRGAAIATVTAQMIAASIGLLINAYKNPEIQIHLSGFKFKKNILRDIYVVAVPSIVMSSIGSVMVYFINKILISFTATAVALFGIIFKLQSFIFLPMFGLNSAVVPIVAYNYGAQQPTRIKKTIFLSIIYANIIMIIGVLIFMLFPVPMLKLFHANANMIQIGIPALRIISLSFLVVGFSVIAVSVFQALGYGFLALIESFLRQIIILLPLAYLFSKIGGLHMIWYSFIFAEIGSSITCFYFLRKLYRTKINILIPDS